MACWCSRPAPLPGWNSYTPPWPLPKIFRMTKGGKIVDGIFEGETINTPSMVAVEDYLDALGLGGKCGRTERPDRTRQRQLRGAGRLGRQNPLGGLPGRRCRDPLQHLGLHQDHRSLVHRASDDAKAEAAKKMASLLEKEGVALDIASYRAAPPGLRIWCGATVEKADIEALTPWLDWAFAQVKG